MLQLDGLTKRFGAMCAVDDVSFRVGGPAMIGIIGRSGVGER